MNFLHHLNKIRTSRPYLISFIIISAVLILAIFIKFNSFSKTAIYENSSSGNKTSNISEIEEKDRNSELNNYENPGVNMNSAKSDEEIKIYIVGCVINPGIVNIKKGQIVNDAVYAAGGLSEDADIENINLVYILSENTMIKINSKKEGLQNSQVINSNNLSSQDGTGKGMKIGTDLGSGALINSQSTLSNSGKSVKNEERNIKININTASSDELDKLPGIGKSTADKIISYRSQNGSFRTKEDLLKVSGIGESKFKRIIEFITVD